jgi:hypothetical protein
MTKVTQNQFLTPSGDPRPRVGRTRPWDDAVRQLFANCGSYDDIVSDEIAAVIDDAIQSGDRVASVSLGLAVLLGYRIEGHPAKYPWRARMNDILRAHAAEVAAAAEEDECVRHVALKDDLISMNRALGMPGGLTALFLKPRSHLPLPGPDLPAYLLDTYLRLLQGWTPFVDSVTTAVLQAVGEYLRDQPELPWVDRRIDGFDRRSGDIPAPAGGSGQFGSLAYLGAAAILAILAESDDTTILDADLMQPGPFHGMLPYLQRRRGGGPDAELPDLPVPEAFRQVFRDWAEGRVHFTKPDAGLSKSTAWGFWSPPETPTGPQHQSGSQFPPG